MARHSQTRYLFSFFHLVGHDGHKEYPQVRFLRYEETVASYRQTVLNAVREVDDALAGTSLLARQ